MIKKYLKILFLSTSVCFSVGFASSKANISLQDTATSAPSKSNTKTINQNTATANQAPSKAECPAVTQLSQPNLLLKVKQLSSEELTPYVKSVLEVHPQLNSKIWDNGNMRSGIRDRLMLIANDFLKSLDLPPGVSPQMITLAGTLTGYNYSPNFSDLDVHIIMQSKDGAPIPDYVKDYIKLVRDKYNNEHHLTVKCFPVEISVDYEPKGRYSLTNGAWVTQPEKIDTSKIPNFAVVQKNFNARWQQMQNLISAYQANPQKFDCNRIDVLFGEIKQARAQSIQQQGVFAPDNLTFKAMRRILQTKINMEPSELKTYWYNQCFDAQETLS